MRSGFAVDSSALIAILNREPDAHHFASVLLDARVIIGWPTAFETRLWLQRRPSKLSDWFQDLLQDPQTVTVAFGREHELQATTAFRSFGKGRHPAGLNFGDCMAYAVAKHEGVPLLFKGSDFGKTDVAVHPASVLA